MQQFYRYLGVGIGNTLIGYAIILVALFAGANDYLANALGYGLGLSFAYLLHRHFTFRLGVGVDWAEATRFVVTAALAYSVNVAALWFARGLGYTENPIAQLFAMAAYSVAFFVLAKAWVFIAGTQRKCVDPA